MSNERSGGEPLHHQQVMDWDMEDHSGVTHLDDVSELLPNTQQVMDIVCDLEDQRGVTHLDESDSELLPNTQQVMDIVCDLEDQRGVTHLDESDSEPMPNTQEVIDIVCDLEDQRGESVSETGHYEGELDTQYLLEYNSDDIYQMSFNFEGVNDSQLSDVGSIPEAKRIRLDNQKGYGKKNNQQNYEDNRTQPLEPEKEKNPKK